MLGIDSDGRKHVLGLREGTTENSRVAQALLRDLLERGLDPERARVFVIDGSKALRAAIRKTFDRLGVVQRCQIHKRRNILAHLPEALHASVYKVLVEAWDSPDAELAERRLRRLADSLETEHPGAAASIREGLEETLTLQRLGLQGALYRTLRSTNTIENLNGSVADYTRNVKRWRGARCSSAGSVRPCSRPRSASEGSAGIATSLPSFSHCRRSKTNRKTPSTLRSRSRIPQLGAAVLEVQHRTGHRPGPSARSLNRAQAGKPIDAAQIMLLLVIAQTPLTLAFGPRGQLGALLAVVVERYAVATRVCDPHHVHDDDRASSGIRGERLRQLLPLLVVRLHLGVTWGTLGTY